MDLFERIRAAGERWNVLEHPFYLRWSRGELTVDELGLYAGEYRHAVGALAEAARAAAELADPACRPALERHAEEEAAHVGLWEGFAEAAGAEPATEPREGTRRCVEAWTAGEGLLERLAILYAIESAQPAISRTKLEGLVERYGMGPGGAATAYFELHAERDAEHAAQSRALIAERLEGADADRLVAVAEGALEGNWALLDGVEAALTGD